MLDVYSEITDRTTETAERENVEYKRKYIELLAVVAKKSSKRAKKIRENRARKKIRDIPEERHLGTTQKYQLGRFTKSVIWKSVKFWHVELEKKAVHKALKHLEVRKSEERIQLRDFVGAFMEKNIEVKRNNTIGAMKKLVCSAGHKSSKFKTCHEQKRIVIWTNRRRLLLVQALNCHLNSIRGEMPCRPW
jgi:hypothetical protein